MIKLAKANMPTAAYSTNGNDELSVEEPDES
jgi:hypothetical protein